jgi:hypothetical protein
MNPVKIKRHGAGWYTASNGYTIEHENNWAGLWVVRMTPFAPDYHRTKVLETFRTFTKCKEYVLSAQPLRNPREI